MSRYGSLRIGRLGVADLKPFLGTALDEAKRLGIPHIEAQATEAKALGDALSSEDLAASIHLVGPNRTPRVNHGKVRSALVRQVRAAADAVRAEADSDDCPAPALAKRLLDTLEALHAAIHDQKKHVVLARVGEAWPALSGPTFAPLLDVKTTARSAVRKVGTAHDALAEAIRLGDPKARSALRAQLRKLHEATRKLISSFLGLPDDVQDVALKQLDEALELKRAATAAHKPQLAQEKHERAIRQVGRKAKAKELEVAKAVELTQAKADAAVEEVSAEATLARALHDAEAKVAAAKEAVATATEPEPVAPVTPVGPVAPVDDVATSILPET